MSNKFNKNTQVMRRPKICLPPIPPLLLISLIEAEILPNPATAFPTGQTTTNGRCHNPDYPDETIVNLSVLTAPFTPAHFTMANDNLFHPFGINCPIGPGIYVVDCKFTWPDSSNAVEHVTIVVAF